MVKDLPTYEEKIKNGSGGYQDRQNTKWSRDIAGKCDHKWQPVQFAMETAGVQPDIVRGRVFCVCMECCSHTYIETGWVGYYIGSPDLLENPEE